MDQRCAGWWPPCSRRWWPRCWPCSSHCCWWRLRGDCACAPGRRPSCWQRRPPWRRTRWSSGVRAGIPTLALLVLLAIASFVPGIGFAAGGATEAAGRDLEAAIGGLQTGAPELVDIDGDLGTYPEIRYATRAA